MMNWLIYYINQYGVNVLTIVNAKRFFKKHYVNNDYNQIFSLIH